jgi:hypothetical protein
MNALLNSSQRRNLFALNLTVMNILGWEIQKGNKDLAMLHLKTKQQLAQKLGVTVT